MVIGGGIGRTRVRGQSFKLITATAVLRLVAEGVVALDNPVSRHLRSLRLANDAVTVRELLAHTGGVDSPPPASLWPARWRTSPTCSGGSGCSGPRGEFAYSDGGYAVLGQLIADLTGTSFARAATRLVLEPLGMADSWFPAEPPVSPHAAYGYELDEEGSPERRGAARCSRCRRGRAMVDRPTIVRFGSGSGRCCRRNSPRRRCARRARSGTRWRRQRLG